MRLNVRALVKFIIILIFFSTFWNCSSNRASNLPANTPIADTSPTPAAELPSKYLNLLESKALGLVVNHTSRTQKDHLVDFLIDQKKNVKVIFAPEHGFRGKADAGEHIDDSNDPASGIPIYSLYGKNKKPSPQQLADIELVVFDIQDVGARFYTYLSTLHYVMEACAEQDIPVIVLDRPNPNGHYVDGPVLKPGFESFVGLHPVPMVYGMTIGEYAKMILGEKWLKDGVQCDLTVIPLKDYAHQSIYNLPIKPSPNLPDMKSIYLYPSLCLFEGTVVSEGRGTDKPFQQYGHPILSGEHSFTPKPNVGSKYPKLEGQICHGEAFFDDSIDALRAKKLDLSHIIQAHAQFKRQEADFFIGNGFFDKLAGTVELKSSILYGKNQNEIRADWEADLEVFKKIRKKYLMYPE